ncbi:MAG: PH domain-containing protein [Clostridia bacterium]|nr:PH domain-containing protein [Clostridia bacterium]
MKDILENTNKIPSLNISEYILWQGQPKKKPFIAKRTFVMMPIAIVWLIFDSSAIAAAIAEGGSFLFIFLPFMALHLIPVWIWLANIISARRIWKNTTYYITNHRIIIQNGFFAINETSIFYKDLKDVKLKIGIFNKFSHTGDVLLNATSGDSNSSDSFEFLKDAQDVYERLQKIIFNIQTDIEYPNALRPKDNPGYNTNYKSE